jgi:hypothetical protein
MVMGYDCRVALHGIVAIGPRAESEDLCRNDVVQLPNKIIAPIVAVSHVLLSERQHPLGHAKPDGENDE